jgi:hypothetical protein
MKASGIRGAQEIIDRLAWRNRPFRARELGPYSLSRAWLDFRILFPIERIARGVYAHNARTYPRIVVAKLRADRGFACLFSALWLHGLIPDEPVDAWICIGHKAWKPRADLVPNTQFVRTVHWPVAEDICELGDWGISTTGLARTAVDFFRCQNRVGLAAANQALELVLASGQCTLKDINACADRYALRRWRPPRG